LLFRARTAHDIPQGKIALEQSVRTHGDFHGADRPGRRGAMTRSDFRLNLHRTLS
jgi:hypothetical protein